LRKLKHQYTHSKLVAELGFGFWRYIFAQHQFTATGRTLLQIFPAKPTSTPSMQYNQTFVFNQLAQLNKIRKNYYPFIPYCSIFVMRLILIILNSSKIIVKLNIALSNNTISN